MDEEREKRAAELRNAVKQVAVETARLKLNLDQTHKMQRVLALVSKQLLYKNGEPHNNC